MSKGRKNVEYDEKVLKDLIKEYDKKANVRGKIKPIDVFNYSQEKYEEGVLPYKLTYDFWKRKDRLGKKLIEEYNEIQSEQIHISERDVIDIVNVQDLIEKTQLSDVKEVEKYLIPMERQIKELVRDLSEEKIKNVNLGNTINELKKESKEKDLKLEKMQNLIYQMFSYSNSGIILDNLMNTGESRNERVINALENAFINPTEFLENVGVDLVGKANKQNNVIKINNDWDL